MTTALAPTAHRYRLGLGGLALLALIGLPMVLGLLPEEARASPTGTAVSACEFHVAALHALERGLSATPSLPAAVQLCSPGCTARLGIVVQDSVHALFPTRMRWVDLCTLSRPSYLIDPRQGSRLLR